MNIITFALIYSTLNVALCSFIESGQYDKRLWGPCPLMHTAVGNMCFRVLTARNFEQALIACREQNSHLIELSTRPRQKYLKEFLKDQSVKSLVWLNGRMRQRNRFWETDLVWEQAGPALFTKWDLSSNSRQGNCVALKYPTYRWIRLDCHRKAAVVCFTRRKAPPVMKTHNAIVGLIHTLLD